MFLVQREELIINHLTLLLVVTMPCACWFLWPAYYVEDFKWHLHFQFEVAFWRVVLTELYFEGPNHVWRALKTSNLNIGSAIPSCVCTENPTSIPNHIIIPKTSEQKINVHQYKYIYIYIHHLSTIDLSYKPNRNPNKGHFRHELRAVTMKLWEPTRKSPKAVPTHFQNYVVWSRILKCSVKPYVIGPSTKCSFNKFIFMRTLTHDKIN